MFEKRERSEWVSRVRDTSLPVRLVDARAAGGCRFDADGTTPIGVRFCEKSAVFRERFDALGTYFGIPVPGDLMRREWTGDRFAVQLLSSTFFTALRVLKHWA